LFSLSNLAYFLFQETIVYEERAITALWEAIASQQEQLNTLKEDVKKLKKDTNKRVVYLRPPKNKKRCHLFIFDQVSFKWI